jgi:hypothetical protein
VAFVVEGCDPILQSIMGAAIFASQGYAEMCDELLGNKTKFES